jgi:hypothetical protein
LQAQRRRAPTASNFDLFAGKEGATTSATPFLRERFPRVETINLPDDCQIRLWL